MVIEDLVEETSTLKEDTISFINETLNYRKLSSPYCLESKPIVFFDYSGEEGVGDLVYKLNRSFSKKYGIQVEYSDKRISLIPMDGPSRGILTAYKAKYISKIENKKSV